MLSSVPFEVRVENLDGGDQAFPHLYGPLPVRAVVETKDVPVNAAGRLVLDDLVDPG